MQKGINMKRSRSRFRASFAVAVALGVPSGFAHAQSLPGIPDPAAVGLTPGTGQNGAPTVSACFYNYRTKVIAGFPTQIASGWIVTNQRNDPACIPPGGLPGPNWQEMTYFRDMPVGASMSACWSFSWPSNWQPVGYTSDPSKCGYYPGGQIPGAQPNVVFLKRVQ
ncbi:hypothetical protein [Burkholderia pseudomallei]|nr:hypothetical protein [Burkholderia pseudomallei]ABN86905.1 hypothetical protein BURPS668_A1199 [Burkholderia pseudomallei 668]ALC60902.1 hypothetical protein AMS56_29845 [Burkholderia pseudomallei]APD37985.1 hypothetical protein BK015_22570 [Burkholderia pseudomallei]APY97079.1 hypothetical protein BGI50_30160 [Burkholderia pseudomallei]APZ22927.1 hypothetical protein BGI47_30885 [Burkholderia pseudomallei]